MSSRCAKVLAMVGLAGQPLEQDARDLSGGQRKRIGACQGDRPSSLKVILYDEPTTGLDPIRADVINELILKLADASWTADQHRRDARSQQCV